MNFEWMEHVGWLKTIKDTVRFRHRAGALLGYAPKLGIVPKPPPRRDGISAMMRIKNEAAWIEPAIRSLAPYVEQFSIVDNGSTDGTQEIVMRTARELSLDYRFVSAPDADFGTVCDLALANTTCRWVLRWDGDMIARTEGERSFSVIRDHVLSLDPERYYVVYFPHINIEGDLFHQDPGHKIHYEDYLFTWSPALHHRATGRFRELIVPLYYTRLHLWETASFHLAGLDSPEDMVVRHYWEAWRNDPETERSMSLEDYAREHIREDFGTDSLTRAGALFVREKVRRLVPYDRESYGDYPSLLEPYLDTYPLRLVYRDGEIVGRTDIMAELDDTAAPAAVESSEGTLPVDVVVPTRNREKHAVETVARLLEQEWPAMTVIVCDQSDSPSEILERMDREHDRLVYHHTDTRGLTVGRNEALRLGTGEIVLYVDDDVVLEEGLVAGHAAVYGDPTVGAAVGCIKERVRQGFPSDVGGRPGKISPLTGEVQRRGSPVDEVCDVATLQGGNMSIRRSVLEEIGGFDERFGGTAIFEETEVSFRIRKAGWRIRYTPDAKLVHLGIPSGGTRQDTSLADIYWYAHNFTLLTGLHIPAPTRWLWRGLRNVKYLRDSLVAGGFQPLAAARRGKRDAHRLLRAEREMRGDGGGGP